MADLPPSLKANPRLSMWLRFEDGEVHLRPGKVEIGQGILTALAQLAAEELEVDISRVRVEAATTGISPDEGFTAGSRSVEESGSAIRQASAELRELFRITASRMLEVPLDALFINDGQFEVAGEILTNYWELAPLVPLDVEANGSTQPKPLTRGRYVGHPQQRLDSRLKVSGGAGYIQNLELPGMLHARVVRPPNIYARLDSNDLDPGSSVQLVRDGSFLGVLAEREEQAIAAAARVADNAQWSSHGELPTQADLSTYLRTVPSELEIMDDFAQPPGGVRRLQATYSRGFVAHGSIGPSCALAVWENGHLRVWSSSQGVYNQRRELARAFGLDIGLVTVEFVEGAGCYGHNGAEDVAYEAALLAAAVPGRPVRLQWMREDELGWAPYGPAAVLDLEATLGEAGRLESWKSEIWSNGTGGRPGHSDTGLAFISATLLDEPRVREPAQLGGVLRNAEPGYTVPQLSIRANRVLESPLRTSSLRSLGAHLNVFAIEGFMDELAEEAESDPIEFRLRHLDDPRGRAVIERAAAEASWGRKLGPDRGLGIGYARYKGVSGYCAVAAEVETTHVLRVVHLTISADVGFVINPDGVINQIMGGAIQSVSWSTLEEVRFTPERVESVTWDTYPILRFSEVPTVSVSLVGSDANPSLGAGEIAQGPTAAAVGNALYSAIGLRVRDMPITSERIARAAGL